MKIIEEPLNKEQREELEGIVSTSSLAVRVVIFFLFVIIIGAFFRWLQGLFWTGIPVWAILTLAISTWCYYKSSLWAGGDKLRAKVREDLSLSKVVISILEPNSVEEIEELEDEGPTYIIKANNGAIYLLSGQELGNYKLKGFPWARIGVIETPHSKIFLGLRQMGNPIPVNAKHKPLTYKHQKELGCFEAHFITLNETKKQLLSEATQESGESANTINETAWNKSDGPVRYFESKTAVELGDRVLLKGWFRKREAQVCYVPGISEYRSDMEYNDLYWVGLALDNGDTTETIVDEDTGCTRKNVELLDRDPNYSKSSND